MDPGSDIPTSHPGMAETYSCFRPGFAACTPASARPVPCQNPAPGLVPPAGPPVRRRQEQRRDHGDRPNLPKIAYRVLKTGTSCTDLGADFYASRETPGQAGLPDRLAPETQPRLRHHHHPSGGCLTARAPPPADGTNRRQLLARPQSTQFRVSGRSEFCLGQWRVQSAGA
jgi:hypothetical protein